MTHTSCVKNPNQNRYIQINEWQARFCQGDHCAALLLSFFIAWHNWKKKHNPYYRQANDANDGANIHGNNSPPVKNAYLFFTMEELASGCLGFYSKRTIQKSLIFLQSLGAISIHSNLSSQYHDDKTKYFKLYPKVFNRWIDNPYSKKVEKEEMISQPIDFKNSSQNSLNKKLSANNASIKEMTDAAEVKEYFAAEKLLFPDAPKAIGHLLCKGADIETFLKAHTLASQKKQGKEFGMDYFLETVESLMANSKARIKI